MILELNPLFSRVVNLSLSAVVFDEWKTSETILSRTGLYIYIYIMDLYLCDY